MIAIIGRDRTTRALTRSAGVVVLLLALPLASAEASVAAETHAQALASTIADRLRIMPDVAAFKWLNDLPIDRPRREAELIDRISHSVAGETTQAAARRALHAQIEASKAIQRALFATWRTTNAPANAVSLDDSRVRIDTATRAFMLALEAFNRHPIDDRCRAATTFENPPTGLTVSAEAWRIAVDGVIPTRCGATAHRG